MSSPTAGGKRLAFALVLLLGVAGSADQTPLTWHQLPPLAVAVLVGAWGARWPHVRPRLPRGRAARRQALYVRAGGRA